MKKMKKYFLLMAASALAAIPASSTVVCSVSSTGTAFGVYDTLSSSNRDVVGIISVTCTGNIGDPVNYVIALSPGGGSFGSRTMQAGSPQLSYNLYSDGAHTAVWGDGTGGTSMVSDNYSLPASSSTRQYTIYGRIPGGQSGAVAGSYADTVVITLTY
jgi:spore coat protein U-like protein